MVKCLGMWLKRLWVQTLFGAFIIFLNPNFGDSMACMTSIDQSTNIVAQKDFFFLLLKHKSKVAPFWIHL
jgi:hypothetical protein